MIIDVHGHFTGAPPQLAAWRQRQIASAGTPFTEKLEISDDELRETAGAGQLTMQKDRGTDLVLFSPTAAGMAHHYGDEETSKQWARTTNDLIHRVTELYPENFIGVAQLPQSPGVSPANCIPELERCVLEYGFVGCNISPDPSDGYWTEPRITDEAWYPLYEKMVELEVPAMVHVSMSCNPVFHNTGAHYINGDTTAFMQLIEGDLFKEFPTLKLIIPHGGGAVPFHWGRYRGLCEQLGRPPLEEHLMNNVYFDTCVYHYPGMQLLLEVTGADNVLFASEMLGAVKGIDSRSGHYYDDTRRYVDALDLSLEDKEKVFEGNAMKVFPRLARKLARANS
jgi:4-oxalmesaconate hydratase